MPDHTSAASEWASASNPKHGQSWQRAENARQSAVAHQGSCVFDVRRQKAVLRHGRYLLAQQGMGLLQCRRTFERPQELDALCGCQQLDA